MTRRTKDKIGTKLFSTSMSSTHDNRVIPVSCGTDFTTPERYDVPVLLWPTVYSVLRKVQSTSISYIIFVDLLSWWTSYHHASYKNNDCNRSGTSHRLVCLLVPVFFKLRRPSAGIPFSRPSQVRRRAQRVTGKPAGGGSRSLPPGRLLTVQPIFFKLCVQTVTVIALFRKDSRQRAKHLSFSNCLCNQLRTVIVLCREASLFTAAVPTISSPKLSVGFMVQRGG